MANDVLPLSLLHAEDKGLKLPKPSNIKDIKIKANEFVSLIACDTMEYRKLNDNRAVKTSITLPYNLKYMAEKRKVNISAVSAEALRRKLGQN
jgi:hypothetical protein